MISRTAAVWRRKDIFLAPSSGAISGSGTPRARSATCGPSSTRSLMASVYFVVFTFIFKAGRVADTPYFLYLLSGLLGWQWFTQSVTDTRQEPEPGGAAGPLDQPPRGRCGSSGVVVAKGVEYILSLPVLVGFVIYYLVRGRGGVDWELLLFPLGTAPAVHPPRRSRPHPRAGHRARHRHATGRADHRCGSSSTSTPVLYGIHAVPEPLRSLLVLNPLNGILSLYRGGLFRACRSTGWDVGVSAAVVRPCCWSSACGSSRASSASVLKEI